MSLPPGFIEELRSRLSLAQVIGRKVSWDNRKSNPGKGDYWAPCPFHQEKTASFHVDDAKGFYYCFGCHAKGDAVTFVRETENLDFIEAIRLLAGEAGMQMPERDPEAAKRAEAGRALADVMELAVQFYRLQLRAGAGQVARDYLATRDMPEAVQDRFEIGWAPDTRQALWSHLQEKSVPEAQIIEAGLCVRPEDGGQPFDRFRGRVMFPIRDARGRCIAFGGRSLDPNARAKYLNSPDTPLFDKGRTLFNIGPARAAAGKAQALIVAEGYMDVIALAKAGFDHAVAPLGTAVTEDQLRMLWRMADEPVIALDGDAAGLRAAMRLIPLALPLLTAGKSLRFCLLPEGQDPDDLLRAGGADAMQAVLATARPMVDLLWQQATEGKEFDSPERRAALDAALRQTIGTITDKSIRDHYSAEIRSRRADLFRPKSAQGGGGWRNDWRGGASGGRRGGDRRGTGFGPVQPSTKSSALAQGNAPDQEARIRESAILMACLNHPALAEKHEAALETLPFACPDLAVFRDALLSELADTPDRPQQDLEPSLAARLGYDPREKLMAVGHVRISRHLRPDATRDFVESTLLEDIAKHQATLGAHAEIRDAEAEMAGVTDEGVTWRLQQAVAARDQANRQASEVDAGDDQTDAAMKKALQDMIDRQIWVKKKR
ncbi:DNA primase [Oceanomicrobium pacificus]|uniref:DNA primase n=1 Tax=Oceanomicrobium pacificus TaxID=2692916 RepID=A0A6B0TN17_9RHOB|nr:DNA primase [Oceanomicrobium pacificus]MXU65246.1 DNA primase [Oceanomicrobium pacificus]